jgi:hypothetical protein
MNKKRLWKDRVMAQFKLRNITKILSGHLVSGTLNPLKRSQK